MSWAPRAAYRDASREPSALRHGVATSELGLQCSESCNAPLHMNVYRLNAGTSTTGSDCYGLPATTPAFECSTALGLGLCWDQLWSCRIAGVTEHTARRVASVWHRPELP